ncbi:UBP1-associated protein 2C-like [Neltuma alba]|uniref:UBP1-associated protein 2C-like n=1 Tax=Neltuma alba TaxID=207710 RepID=UPI0010A43E3A|nr:UBP1-associated protein 2C-like [Prosopis alba]XP_028764708.1 UBP1-associated protein 2C-like [Prosopis alba]XP_028764895.1 UBP1-associated protein 2C-like [Prosopis alba]XP_028764896.1 UBP1-associated protein 2C-like [Prosopis alba]XP_028782240.1 UBP1-associated protein 2C-like [Prosopis alba]XP_028782241.1 UBP1-associated protein 2C-like [Prosopis alba]
MDFSKKRKAEENGIDDSVPSTTPLGADDIRKILQPFNQEQLIDLLLSAALHHPDVLESIRSVADRDSTLRKLFVRGLAGETTTETLSSVFSSFGVLDEAIVIFDKTTGKSKGYGFVTFKHVDGAILALKEPSKKIDGRMTVTQLAASGLSASQGTNAAAAAASDVSARKIFVGNVPFDISSERLLSYFLAYGEIEEGPLGFDKANGKSKGFAFFVYKTEEGARASLVEPVKTIDGHQVLCKLAMDNKKGKSGGAPNQGPAGLPGNGMAAQQPQPSLPGPMMGSNYGGHGPSYGGFGGAHQGPMAMPSNNYGLQSSLPPYGTQVPSTLTPNSGGGYGPGIGGAYSGSQFSGPTSGDYGARLPSSSAGMPTGGYPDGSHYNLPSSAVPSQHQQPMQMPRMAPGGMYQGMPPYY